MMNTATVALIGCPNVGKSSLFNALTKSRKSLVHDRPGVTRDRIYSKVEGDEMRFWLIDTGGFEKSDSTYQPFDGALVWKQTLAAIEEADLVVLVFDGRAGLSSMDHELWKLVKSSGKPILPIVNKIDGYEQQSLAFSFCELGIDLPHCVSAAHRFGLAEFFEILEQKLQELGFPTRILDLDQKNSGPRRMALVGRPNVGKSSIINRLAGEERTLVSPVAGTTRDTCDIEYRYNGQAYTIIDTAGIRRRANVTDKVESLSIMKSMQAIEDADVVLLVVDAEQGFADQDARLASWALALYKPTVIAVNKWDLVENKDSMTSEHFKRAILHKIRVYGKVPVIFLSCLENRRVFRVMESITEVYDQANRRVSTSDLNKALAEIVEGHTPALEKATARLPKFYYATQVGQMPPRIIVKTNIATDIQESYQRYMNKSFREKLGFTEVPISLIFRFKGERKPRARRVDQASSD